MLLPIRKTFFSCFFLASLVYFFLSWKLWDAGDDDMANNLATTAPPLETENRSPQSTNDKIDHDFPLGPRNYTAGKGWIFEPVSLRSFWSLADRRVIRGMYPPLRKFHRVLDVGARGYNQECKGLINSNTTEYYQVEPFPPDVMNNDGLLPCKVQEIPELYPQYESFFDVVLDFGVFGWRGTHQFNTTQEVEDDMRAYINGILFVLKPKGMWILKVDRKWVPNQNEVFHKFILPHFTIGSYDKFSSGMNVKRFRFYFFHYKKGNAQTI
jgi:hypothetical protein